MPARILIIEDNEANLELMSYLLRAFGHAVIAARDGENGLALVRSERPDLILCDIQLPGIGGMDVARRLASDAVLDPIPVLAVTALAMVGDRETIMAAGFDGYFTKPIAPETFVQKVDAFLPPERRGESALPSAAANRAAAAVSPQGHTLLVVDDKQVHLDLAASLFGGSGYRVLTANGMRAALTVAAQSPPDLILSDVHMGDASGYDFIREVKADPRLKSIPFVFITATTTTERERRKGLALGAVKFLFRPIESQDLLREVEACLGEPKKS